MSAKTTDVMTRLRKEMGRLLGIDPERFRLELCKIKAPKKLIINFDWFFDDDEATIAFKRIELNPDEFDKCFSKIKFNAVYSSPFFEKEFETEHEYIIVNLNLDDDSDNGSDDGIEIDVNSFYQTEQFYDRVALAKKTRQQREQALYAREFEIFVTAVQQDLAQYEHSYSAEQKQRAQSVHAYVEELRRGIPNPLDPRIAQVLLAIKVAWTVAHAEIEHSSRWINRAKRKKDQVGFSLEESCYAKGQANLLKFFKSEDDFVHHVMVATRIIARVEAVLLTYEKMHFRNKIRLATLRELRASIRAVNEALKNNVKEVENKCLAFLDTVETSVAKNQTEHARGFFARYFHTQSRLVQQLTVALEYDARDLDPTARKRSRSEQFHHFRSMSAG